MKILEFFGFPSKEEIANARVLGSAYAIYFCSVDKIIVPPSEIMKEEKYKNDLKLAKEIVRSI